MDVDTSSSDLTPEHDGRTSWLCDKGCLLGLRDDPERFLDPGHSRPCARPVIDR